MALPRFSDLRNEKTMLMKIEAQVPVKLPNGETIKNATFEIDSGNGEVSIKFEDFMAANYLLDVIRTNDIVELHLLLEPVNR
jgi:hypothetical protein